MSSKDFWANYFSLSGTLIENMKKQKNKKREQSLQNSILEKLKWTWFTHILCQGQGQVCTQQGRFVGLFNSRLQ